MGRDGHPGPIPGPTLASRGYGGSYRVFVGNFAHLPDRPLAEFRPGLAQQFLVAVEQHDIAASREQASIVHPPSRNKPFSGAAFRMLHAELPETGHHEGNHKIVDGFHVAFPAQAIRKPADPAGLGEGQR